MKSLNFIKYALKFLGSKLMLMEKYLKIIKYDSITVQIFINLKGNMTKKERRSSLPPSSSLSTTITGRVTLGHSQEPGTPSEFPM